jgi:hypothetical protein
VRDKSEKLFLAWQNPANGCEYEVTYDGQRVIFRMRTSPPEIEFASTQTIAVPLFHRLSEMMSKRGKSMLTLHEDIKAAVLKASKEAGRWCKCGHLQMQHYHEKGMCDGTESYGSPCQCRRFKKGLK